jgi:FlaA1/EpsC-like NDP-sugar epimerase
MHIPKKVIKDIINLPRYSKRIIAIILDIGICVLCTWIAFYLRLEQIIKISDTSILSVLISICLAIPIFWLLGLYKSIFRFEGLSIVVTMAVATLFYGFFYFLIISIYGVPGVPRSIGVIQPLLIFFGVTGSRVIIKNLFFKSLNSKKIKNKKKVLIYGAGNAGRQLLFSLENNPEMKVIGFIDDNQQFHNQTILGQMVYDPLNIDKIIHLKNVDLVLLALPSISRVKRNKIINHINKSKIIVKTLPSVQDIVDGKISVSDIKDLSVEDLLSREQVQPNLELLSKDINSKVVMVTGAGGSIGSELCRQIIKLRPKKLLLLELNEFALYRISEELNNNILNFKIIPLLVNIQNLSRVNKIFKTFKVDTVYHAAAYKHVSLVEENICESIKNNVMGTFQVAQTAIKNNVSNFVLISSDKAVRATNVMGASKRLAEICVQSLYYNNKNKHTKFAIVRFGNVLESSGSVIPKFKKQIKEGGPVTLTHPEVTRYFMTITEASQLVIQAGAMSEGCEVFVLDMGESIKIKDLIDKMIKLSGLTVKDTKNLEGDIEIKIIGLRPGEKLYEELLLGDNPQKTFHDKIQKAQDPYITFEQLKIKLDILSVLIEDNMSSEVKDILNKLLPSYKSNSKIVDHIYKEQLDDEKDIESLSIVKDHKQKVISIKAK